MTAHIIYCATCGNAWTDRCNADLRPGEGPCMCTCANPEDERWVAMTTGRFVSWAGPEASLPDPLTQAVETNRRLAAEDRRICLACYDSRHGDCTGGRLTGRGALMICVCNHEESAL